VAAVSVRDLDDGVKERLRVRAAQNGRSMEAEIREILTAAVRELQPERDWLTQLQDAAAAVGGVELDIPPRGPGRPPPDFSSPDFG